MRIICVNTGTKFESWYVDNLKHMIDNFSNLQYDKFEVITEILYGGVYDKLQIFDKFREGQNLYFDLDVVITGDCNQFVKKEFTLCKAWWRKPYHTPLNSSIMSWYGDKSDIFKGFKKHFKKIYYRGITGVNLPMLICAINHKHLSLDSLLEKVLEAKEKGIESLNIN